MSFVYTNAKRLLLNGSINLATDDMRALLVMTNTTVDTEEDLDTIGAFATLDEMNGTGYVRKTLAGLAVSENNTSNVGIFDATDITWTALGSGTRQLAGLLLYKHVTNDADAIPFAFIDSGGFPFNPSGLDVVIQWNANGILQLS